MAAAPVAPPSLLAIAERAEARLVELLDPERARWTAVDDALAPPFDALIRLVLAGGKRLRPAFCHWGYIGAGGDPESSAIVDAGAALELLHTFALLHDDIMDASATRRGMPAAHVAFERRHAQEGWRGEGRRFGEGAAILVGDLAFVYADLLLTGAPRVAIDVFNELRLEVNVGQYLDLVGAAAGVVSREQASLICTYKSGKYTIERPLHLGAALAGGLDRHADALTGYGIPLGEAFQLRDDILGALGDEAETGKPVGDDLREGKPTALVALAWERGDDRQRKLLESRLGEPDLDADEVAELQAVLVDTGAAAELTSQVDSLAARAISAVEASDLAPEAVERLVELAHFVAGRSY